MTIKTMTAEERRAAIAVMLPLINIAFPLVIAERLCVDVARVEASVDAGDTWVRASVLVDGKDLTLKQDRAVDLLLKEMGLDNAMKMPDGEAS